MSIKDWSFGRKLMMFLCVLLILDLIGFIVIFAVAQSPNNPISKFYDSMRARYGSTESSSESTIKSSTVILRFDPDNIKALRARAEAYCEEYEYKLALADYEHLNRLQPKSIDWIKGKARCLFEEDAERAIEEYSKVIAMEGPQPESLLNRAKCFSYCNKNMLALKDLQATSHMKLRIAQLAQRADIYDDLGRKDLYEADLLTAIDTRDDRDEDRRKAMDDLYRYYLNLSKYDLALKSQQKFLQAVRLSKVDSIDGPEDGLKYHDLKTYGDILLVSGKTTEAVAAYREALDMDIAAVSKTKAPEGEYYGLVSGDLVNEVEMAKLIGEPGLLNTVETDVTEHAIKQIRDGERDWYGDLVTLIGTLSQKKRVELGTATIEFLSKKDKKRIGAKLDIIEIMILMGVKDDARKALAELNLPEKDVYRTIPLYLKLGDMRKAATLVHLIPREGARYDSYRYCRLEAEYGTGDIKAAQKTAKQMLENNWLGKNDYLRISKVAAASKDIVESKRLKKIAAALGQIDALMDIRNGKP